MRSTSFLCLFVLVCCLVSSVHVHAAVSPQLTSPIGGTAGFTNPICYSHWQNIGPFHVAHIYPTINLINDPEDIGAAEDVWVSGDNAYLATTNGGVWRTSGLHTASAFGGPHWVPATGNLPCMSMQTISGSATDANTVVAGCGYSSNDKSRGGEAKGVMMTQDGTTWSMTAFPAGWWVSSVVVSGSGATSIINVAAKQGFFPHNEAGSLTDSYGIGITSVTQGGIWKSTNGGTSFTQKYLQADVGVNKIVRHSTTSTTLFAAAIVKVNAGAWPSAVLVSTDEGSTWTATTGIPDLATTCNGAGFTTMTNSQVAFSSVGGATRLYYAAYIDDGNYGAPCYAYFYSSDLGATWNTITNVPTSGTAGYLGTQGGENFAILADPTTTNILFVAATGGVVFRVDTSTSTWTWISTAPVNPAPTAATASSTAPHADARTFFWDSTTGDLLLTNDGGLYKRTNPLQTPANGDWTSLAGDLSTTEAYQVAFDPVSGAMIIGAQDNSVMLSQFDATEKTTGIWNYLLTGDGTSVGVDTSASPAQFYGADQSLAGWFKVAVNANSGSVGVASAVTTFGSNIGTCSPGDSSCLNFFTPNAVNKVTPSQALICTQKTSAPADSTCYINTFPSTSTATEFSTSALSISDIVTSYTFGGWRNGASNANVIMAVGQTFIWSRDVNTCTTSSCVMKYTGSCTGTCTTSNMLNTAAPWSSVPVSNSPYIIQNPSDYYINVVIDDAGHSWITADFGQTWKDLNLPANSNLISVSGHTTVDTTFACSAIFVPVVIGGVTKTPLIIGTSYGSFISFDAATASSFTFIQLGANQPHTIPTSYVYTPSTDTLLMSTLGRGLWTLTAASYVIASASTGAATNVVNSACTGPLYPNVANAYGYTAGGISPTTIGFENAGTGGGPIATSTGSTSTGSGSTTGGGGGTDASSGGGSNPSSANTIQHNIVMVAALIMLCVAIIISA